jgi:hypothetical protein
MDLRCCAFPSHVGCAVGSLDRSITVDYLAPRFLPHCDSGSRRAPCHCLFCFRLVFSSTNMSIAWELSHVSSNQTMKLTATVLRFGGAFLVATFLSPQIGLSPSGRSLSFSR